MTTLSTNIYNGILAVSSGGTGTTTLDKSLNALGGQSLLVSGANVGTVNGNSVLGSTNIAITEDTSTTVQTSAYTASANQLVKCNTASGTFTVTLPLSPVDGDIIKIVDVVGKFGTNALTVSPNGKTIENDTSLILDVNNANISIMYINNNWKLLDIAPTIWISPPVPVFSVFSTTLYIGNGSTQTINNGIDLAGKGGLVWVKGRNLSWDHTLYDTVNGVGIGPLNTATTAAPNPANNQRVTAFNSNGFTLGTNGNVNGSGYTYVSWTFRKAPKFFDVVTYTGDGNASRAIPHSLGIRPGFVTVKSTSVSGDWQVLCRATDTAWPWLQLNLAATQSGSYNIGADISASSFNVGGLLPNASGVTYVAYVFAHDTSSTGIIQCGSYTGNGTTSPPSVSLGWEPQYVLIKKVTGTMTNANWFVFDAMRGVFTNGNDAELDANSTAAENNTFALNDTLDFTATGFSIKFNHQLTNESSSTYIYMAIRK
jgi:hypothetical protein